MPFFHFDEIQPIVGFAAANLGPGGFGWFQTGGLLFSDDPTFYTYTDQISNLFLRPKGVVIDTVQQFLVLIHRDRTADLYVNDLVVTLEIKAKGELQAGQVVTSDAIADVRRLRFPDIEILETDQAIYCFRLGWRFGLFFDVGRTFEPVSGNATSGSDNLDVEAMERSLASLYRRLCFYGVYKVLESKAELEKMMADGWFPFVEIIAGEYDRLIEAYQHAFGIAERTEELLAAFTDDRVRSIANRWWANDTFAEKRSVIEAGVNAYLQNSQDGNVNCIKNLCTEIEGILRKLYHVETGKVDRVKSSELIKFITERARTKAGAEDSLLLSAPFLDYLRDVVFANFQAGSANVKMSRNSATHGVATPELYTRQRALQMILTLDQIYFCL